MLQQALAFLCGCLGGTIWAKKGHEGGMKNKEHPFALKAEF